MSILSRLVNPNEPTLSKAAAESVLKMQFDAADQARIGELASKSNQGALTPEEATEYDSYIAAADFLALLKSKARLSLKQQPSAA